MIAPVEQPALDSGETRSSGRRRRQITVSCSPEGADQGDPEDERPAIRVRSLMAMAAARAFGGDVRSQSTVRERPK